MDGLPDERTTAGDMTYDWDLAGPCGAAFYLYREPRHTDEDVAAAKAELRRDRDVVSIRVKRWTN